MDMIDIKEFKETMVDFQNSIVLATKEEDYDGEADDLLASLERAQKKMKDIESLDQLEKEVGQFGWDLIQILTTIHAISDFDEEDDFEFDELD